MNNIYNRYIWLLHTVYQERKVTFERLCEIWKHYFLYNGKPLSLRTFHHHRKMIEENFDIVIACNRKDYTYYVSIRPTTGIKPLYTTIATVTMNLIVSAANVLLNPYVTV